MSIARMERLGRTRREEKGFSLSLSQLQLGLVVMGVLAAWVLAFTLGAVWGRGSTRVSQMERGERLGLVPEASALANYKDEFTFYQTLSDEKTDLKKSPDPKVAEASSRPEEVVVAKEAQATLAPAPSEKTGGTVPFAVQVGSFRSKENADSLSATLTARGYSAEVNSQSLSAGVWHRVLVVGYSTKEEAEAVGEKLKTIDKLVAGYLVTVKKNPKG